MAGLRTQVVLNIANEENASPVVNTEVVHTYICQTGVASDLKCPQGSNSDLLLEPT